MAFDCSQKNDNNPTRLLQDSYQELMAITELETLKEKTFAIVESSSISKKNFYKFTSDHNKVKTLVKYQGFITNFILAGSGLSVD